MKRYFPPILAALLMVGFVIAQTSRRGVESAKYTGHTPKTHPITSERYERHPLDEVYSSDDSVRIPDYPGDTAVSVIYVRDALTITDLNVFVDIRHPFLRDLRVSLTAPRDSVEVVLFNLFAGDSVVDIRGWFDDNVDSSIYQATPPLIGSWRPQDSLRAFNGLSSEGDWTLRVYDRFRVDSGYIAAWALDINHPIVLTGNVRDSETRLPLAGVMVKPIPSYFSALTGTDGAYSFNQLDPGVYSLQFSKRFYDTVTVENVEIIQGQIAQINANLNPLFLIFENFDNTRRGELPQGWIQISRDSGYCAQFGDSSVWQVRDSLDPHSGTMVVANFFNDPVNEQDVPNDDWLILPQVNATGTITLRHWAASQDSRYLEHYQVLVSATEAIPDSFTTLIQDITDVPAVWTEYTHDLSAFSGHPFYIAFHYISVNMFALKIDDVVVENEVTVTASETAPRFAADWTFYGGYPNPFNSAMQFRFDLARREHVTLRLYDLLGRLVALVTDQSYEIGPHSIRFEATGRLASGLYIASMTVGGDSQNRKIILLK